MEGSINDARRTNYLVLLRTCYEIYGIYEPLLALFAVYSVAVVVYRLYLHPLARFPGPKLAAATGWYEFYHDVFRGGQYLYEIESMHRKYGPIIRINPHELVVNDPDFYNTVFVAANTRRTDKWSGLEGIGLRGSLAFTRDHDLHRIRRKRYEPFFSRLSVSRIEPIIVDEAKLLAKQLEASSKTGRVIELEHVMSAFTGDVITTLCSEKSPDMIRHPEFGKGWHTSLYNFPSCFRAGAFNSFLEYSTDHINTAKREMLSVDKLEQNNKSSVFRYVLSTDMPQAERDTERLAREAALLFGAGSVTTTRFFSVTIYYTLRNRQIRDRLSAELKDVMAGYPSTLPTWQELDRLPYLHAIVKEGLRYACPFVLSSSLAAWSSLSHKFSSRLSYGVMRHLSRISPDSALHYKQWTIPPGTPVGMSSYSLHTDPETFPEPFKFMPERWLGEYNPKMNRSWVPFTRGSRNCLGMNLAYAQIYWGLAVMFRPGGPRLELYETNESDIRPVLDFLGPLPKSGSRGLRVTVS
uniref:Stellatic acid synthase n=1 Tax=Emericella variicolor TaxID=1549217 RepID=STLP4_EMEVA|nr:RecName: Full=Stellatic acid synthase; AltName: Full=Cytochrome P450 monooxygenase Stl-P450; AltName: Full=Stellatic acid biosynthetis gene clusters protein Stl-P450 [Aspergillus stellatus]BAT32890.1 stellatic acid synthase [Aspergillus stellatus]